MHRYLKYLNHTALPSESITVRFSSFSHFCYWAMKSTCGSLHPTRTHHTQSLPSDHPAAIRATISSLACSFSVFLSRPLPHLPFLSLPHADSHTSLLASSPARAHTNSHTLTLLPHATAIMVILSAPPSCSLFFKSAALAARQQSSTSTSGSGSRLSSVFSGNFAPCGLALCPVSRSRMAEFGHDERKDSTSAAAAALEAASGSSSSCSASELSLPLNFVDFRTEEDMLYGIRKAAESGRIPLNVSRGMEELYENYRNAVYKSGDPKAHEVVLYNMALVFDRVFMDVKDPFEFSSYHKAIREPFDYYLFGQNYIRPLVDFRNSYVGNLSLFHEIEEKLLQGENIILMSNHQTEADPAVMALLLESTNPHLAENMTYVAGDRVISDPLCKPFSMGRNLLCVYSKKHMHDVPELTEMKRRANTKSLKEMALLLRSGSTILWIAPSGGRDRPDSITEEWYPAPFDSSSVDNMRRLVEHAGVPGHIYPLAILCHDIMPPPAEVEKEIGEKRVISFHGTGLSVGPEINFNDLAASLEDLENAKTSYTQALYDSVVGQYNVLKSAVHGKEGLGASTPTVSLSQPWQ